MTGEEPVSRMHVGHSRAAGAGPALRRVAVVVPAHNEEATLRACLASVGVAARHSPVPVEVITVLDACTDSSAACLDVLPHGRALRVGARNVGSARAAGMAAALGGGPEGLWLMTTDADSLVPPHWVAGHLAHAARGADVVVGTVAAVDWSGWPAGLAERYDRRYAGRTHPSGLAHGHGHVHGANLGLRAGAYLAVGGFPALPTAEDHAIVDAARARHLRVLTVTDVPVITSTRALARAPHGFSEHLRLLAEEEPVA